jgi:hypothetical protein
MAANTPRLQWPDGKRFAFTVFDDTDAATLENVGEVYTMLTDLGFRTTKSCWPLRGLDGAGKNAGQTCADDDYRSWLMRLQAKGFEMAWHGATWQSSPREETIRGLDAFAAIFGHDPRCGANHTDLAEGIYWADKRLTGINALAYNLLTRRRNHGHYLGEIPGNCYYWGDVCRERIKYYRNFVFQEINTLNACPLMPYHDPRRPLVQNWFAASNGVDCRRFNHCISEKSQDRLDEEGGACVMYTHFAFGFLRQGQIEPRFRALMERLAKKGGWFVPVSTLLDHLLAARGPADITDAQRGRLERKWLIEKIIVGST